MEHTPPPQPKPQISLFFKGAVLWVYILYSHCSDISRFSTLACLVRIKSGVNF